MNNIILDPVTKRFSYQEEDITLLKRDGVVLDPITKRFTDNFAQLKREIRRIRARASPDNANGKELKLWEIFDEYFPYTYKYVGDFQVRIGKRWPDFININGKKEVVEFFGSFWHRPGEVQSTLDHYKQCGFSCTIIWEEELEDVKEVVEHIKNGGLYIPKYKGFTIFDYGEGIVPEKVGPVIDVQNEEIKPKITKPKITMESQIAVNFTLMLSKSLAIQAKPEQSRGRRQSPIIKELNARLRRMEFLFERERLNGLSK